MIDHCFIAWNLTKHICKQGKLKIWWPYQVEVSILRHLWNASLILSGSQRPWFLRVLSLAQVWGHLSGNPCVTPMSFSSKRQPYSHSPASWTESLQLTHCCSLTSFPSASEIVWAVEGGRQRDIDKDRKAFGAQRQTFPVRSHQSHLEGERGSQARSEGSWEQYLRTQETGRIQDSLQEAPQGGGEGPLAD